MNISKYNKNFNKSAVAENSAITSVNDQDEGIFTFDMESSNVDQNVADVKSCVNDRSGVADVKSSVGDQSCDDIKSSVGYQSGDDVKSSVDDQSGDDVKSFDDDGQGDSGFPVIQNFSDIKNNILNPVLIDGVLRKGNKLMITGPSKSGKSFLMRQLGLAVASGTSWLGMKCEKGKVLYLDLEHDRATLQTIFHDMSIAMNAEELIKDSLYYIDLKGISIGIKDFKESIVDLVNEKIPDISLIIIDSISFIDYGDANSVRDVAYLIRGLNFIAQKTGAAIAYCNHHSNGASYSKSVIDIGSASGALARMSDAVIDISTCPDKDGKKNIRVETVLRKSEAPKPCLAVFEYPLFKVIDA